ncbi:antibiotic biosynthesis monooxygenase [Thiohalophilus sp.]|uniref:antibiotic biosynthesis monooxygenase family protein n=1 Tax=Thiohalophilus sp. TaxID=3028392 RepID=UPI002ACE7BBF|nr:antibiotic biosynthesis monooxygenase [Thiohalophilus sp.]MDZ7802937.1 antibiotic biosynthesis monooxygenase [Thiohalophilus sp.]
MIAVIFEVIPTADGKQEYLSIAAQLRKDLKEMPGFISIERFQSLSDDRKILSLSFWEDEEAICRWRNLEQHRIAQGKGRGSLFQDYRIRVGAIVRDYSLDDRTQAPEDSKSV